MQHLSPFLFSLAVLAKASLFTACCLVLGHATRQLIGRLSGTGGTDELNLYLNVFFHIAVGQCVLTMVLFLLGCFSLLSLPVISAVLIVMLLASLSYLNLFHPAPFNAAKPASGRAANWTGITQCIFFAGLFVLAVFIAVGPPGHWDDTSYHLPYARHYVENHAILINQYLRFPLLPHNGDLLFSLGLMYGTAIDAQVLAMVPLFVISLGFFGACQVLIRAQTAGYLVVLLFFALGPLKGTLGYAYIDSMLALYCWAAILALAMWLRNPRYAMQWLITCGILAGTAAGTKLLGGVVAVLLGLYLLVVVRRLRLTLVYALTTALFGLGWYVRSFYLSGDPVHPLGGNIFGHFLWNATDLASAAQEQATHGAEKSLLNILGILKTAGVLPLFPALLVVLQPAGRHKPVLFMYVIFLLYFLFWLFSSQVDRYLAPLLPVGAFLSVFFLYQAGRASSLSQFARQLAMPWLRHVWNLVGAVCGFAMILSGWQLIGPQLANWDTRLKGRAGYEIMTAANDLMPQYGKVMLQVGYENALYFFHGTAIGDWFGPGRYSNMLRCAERCQIAPAAHMASLMNGFGAKMLAVNAKVFQFDPQQYMDLFEIKKQTEDGYLLILNTPR